MLQTVSSKLENVADPEEKRKIIGGEFIRVFEEEARKLDGIDFLGQGKMCIRDRRLASRCSAQSKGGAAHRRY